MKNRKRILIADDENEMIELLQEIFKIKGYEILVASGGIQAVDMAIKYEPDLILLDMNMPHGSGPMALMVLKSKPKIMNIPVMVLTASKDSELEKNIRANGAEGFMTKPFEIPSLLEKAQALMA